MELPFDDWLAGNGSSPWSITFPQYMRLSQEPPRKSPKTKPLKTAIRVTKLARRYEVSIALSSFYMTSSHLQRKKRRVKGRMGNHRKAMRARCAAHAAKVTTTSGPAVTCVRNVSMASAWRLPQPKLNTSGSTSAPPAQAARLQEGQGLSQGNPNGQQCLIEIINELAKISFLYAEINNIQNFYLNMN